jgi:hypothetical protein
VNNGVGDEIPYERQDDPTSNRMCGAAALCMVYRSFGLSIPQAELAPRLRQPGAPGNSSARTHLLAQDALSRGLGAVVLRAREPHRSLRQVHHQPVRLILNHRLRRDSASGHFSVLVRVGQQEAVVHDPQRGPNTRLPLDDLIELWRPLGGPSEISGNVFVAVTAARTAPARCPTCTAALPDTVVCPACRKPFPLHPAAVLGCMDTSCAGRTWDVLFCPYCDTGVVDALAPGASGLPGEQTAEADDDPLKLMELSQGIDQFIAVLLKVSGGAAAPALQNQITAIRTYQAQMLELQKSEAAERKAQAAQPAAGPPPVPRAEHAAVPEPSAVEDAAPAAVDWNELGRQLVEEMGRKPT